MGFMTPPLPQTLKLRLIKVVFQNWYVIRMCTLLDDHTGSFFRRQTAHVSETLLRDDDVEIVLGLVDVRAHGHYAGHARGICFRRARRRRVHYAVFCAAQKVCGAAEAVEHAAAHYAGRVCVGVDVDFDGGVHTNDAETSYDFGRVGDLLRAEEQLGCVAVPVLVEAVETFGRETDGGCGGEVEVA
jgi:hypothetical protein